MANRKRRRPSPKSTHQQATKRVKQLRSMPAPASSPKSGIVSPTPGRSRSHVPSAPSSRRFRQILKGLSGLALGAATAFGVVVGVATLNDFRSHDEAVVGQVLAGFDWFDQAGTIQVIQEGGTRNVAGSQDALLFKLTNGGGTAVTVDRITVACLSGPDICQSPQVNFESQLFKDPQYRIPLKLDPGAESWTWMALSCNHSLIARASNTKVTVEAIANLSNGKTRSLGRVSVPPLSASDVTKCVENLSKVKNGASVTAVWIGVIPSPPPYRR